MSELAIIAALVKSTLSDVSKQALALANGLQNAAPGSEKEGKMVPNKSIQYLFDISDKLSKSSEMVDQFQPLIPVKNLDDEGKERRSKD